MKVLANDSITLTKIIDGANGTNSVSVILSSYAINLPSNSEGAVIDYSNSQVDIIVLEGQESLTPTLNTSLSNRQFRLKNTTLKNIGSIAQSTIDQDKIKTGVISQFASNQDSGSAEFEIEYKTSTGDTNTVNMTLTFAKAKQGLAGIPGKDGKPVFTSIRYSNEICDRENFVPTTATINPNADTFSIGIYTGEIDYDSPNNHWEQNLDKYKWSAYGQQSIKEIKTTFKATSLMNKPNSIDFKDSNIPSDFNAQNKYLWKKDVYYYNGTNTTTESINLIATYGKDGQSANTLSATSGSYSINKSEVVITGNSAHTDALNSIGTNLFVYNYDGSLAEKINYNTYSDPNLCNTLLTKIQSLRDKIFVLMECDSGSMTQQLRNELILSGGSQTDTWNKQRRAWIFISLSKKSTNNQYPLQKGQAYEVSSVGDNKKENLTVSLTGSGIVANGSTGIGVVSIETKYQATTSASKPTQGWGDSTWSTTIPTLTDNKKYLYSITRYTYSDNRTTDIIDLISVKGSDGENGKILYQDTVPVAPSIGTQWFNTGTNNGYINNTLYVFDGKNWKVMEFSAENIKTNVLNALQANMDNTNVSHKLIVGNKTGKRVELDGYDGTLTIYNSNNQKVFYTGADGNLNFQGNLSFSSGSSVSEVIDNKANQSDLNTTNKNLAALQNTGINVWLNSNFSNGFEHWMKNSNDITWSKDATYQGTKVLNYKKSTTTTSWVYVGTSDRYPVTPGEKISVGWLQQISDGDKANIFGELQLYPDKTSERSGTFSIRPNDGTIGKWVQSKKEAYVVPSDVNYIGINFYIKGAGEANITQPQIVHGEKLPIYQPCPDDLNNTNDILGNKANTSYVDNKIDNISVGGTNLILNSSPMPTLATYPTTSDSILSNDWQKFTTDINGKEILPKNSAKYTLKLDKDTKIVQSIAVKTNGTINSAQFTFYDGAHHYVDANIKLISNNGTDKIYQLWCQYNCLGTTFRAIDINRISYQHNTYIAFSKPKIEIGTIPTEWSPAPEDKANQDDLINQLKNRSNLWPDSTFENKKLSDYSTIPDGNNLVHIVTNGAKSTANDSPREYGVEYRKQNSSDKALRFEGRTDGNRDCFLKDDYMFDVSDGDVFNVSYDFYKQASSTATVGFKCIKYDGSTVDWLGVSGKNNSGANWWHKDGQITIPSGKGIVKVLPYAALNKTTNTSDYLYIDNIVITQQDTKQNSIDTQVKSQQTQINQKANRVDIIATSNENPKAYFTLGTLDDGRGYVSVGADYGFFLNTNTFVSEGFKLSANHIDAGLIRGKQPAWMTEPSIPKPDDFKNSDLYSPQLDLGEKNVGEMSLTLFSNFPPTLTSKYYWTMKSQFTTRGLNFNSLYWTDSNILEVGNTASISGSFDENNPRSTAIILSSGKYGLKVVNQHPYLPVRDGSSYAHIGGDGADSGRSAIASWTMYANRLQSLSDNASSYITVDDDIYFKENSFNDGYYAGNKNNNYTIIGTGRDGSSCSLAFLSSKSGNTVNSKTVYHNIVPYGTGAVVAFSNDNNGISNWSTSDVGSAYVLCKGVTETSNKDLKVVSSDIDTQTEINQAVNDILKINARKYRFKADVEAAQRWEEQGQPEDKFFAIDTKIDIGLFAEDLAEYPSLQPLLNIIEDEFGNEDLLGVNYSRLSVLLLEVVKKQEERISNLEEKIVKMEIEKA